MLGFALACPLLSQVGPTSVWPDGARLEQLLREGKLVSQKKIGAGVTDSSRVTLDLAGERIDAIFKSYHRENDSWRREVAAYELDKWIGLGMVPPTIERSVKGKRGCVQLWVEGEIMVDAESDPDDKDLWRHQVSTMWLFDYLTANTDRHLNNALVSPDGQLVLIDNSRAFRTYTGVLPRIDEARGATRARFWLVEYDQDRQRFETHYRDELIERIRALTPKDLKQTIGKHIDRPARDALLSRRDRILAQIDEMRDSKD